MNIGETVQPKRSKSPIARFVELESSGGIILMLSALLAMILANSGLSSFYFAVANAKVPLWLATDIEKSTVQHWVNDGLMAIFFLVVGLELKRELLVGELRSWKVALLPAAAAAGGMIVPALIYTIVNLSGSGAHGWGIPMATDIAFSLGVLALLGSRVSGQLKVLLTAIAIADDLGAILIIALFYGSHIDGAALAWSGAILVCLGILNAIRVQWLAAYFFLGLGLWFFMLRSGVHATIAGVLVAMTIPLRSRAGSGCHDEPEVANTEDDYGNEVALGSVDSPSPLHRAEQILQPWVAYMIVPIFALVNAGVRIDSSFLHHVVSPISLGIGLGLVIGKPVGIVLASLLAVKFGVGVLPKSIGLRELVGLGCIAGVGFTMSLFISNLAFSNESSLQSPKIGILTGSLVAALMGLSIFKFSKKNLS